jgi:short-chain Z-isoprenyl diphosphate synthase
MTLVRPGRGTILVMALTLRTALDRLYTVRLRRRLMATGPLPAHVGLIMDGNRRWARQQGFDNASVGHRHGAEHLEEFLLWAGRLGIGHVTVFVCSTENLTRRSAGEVAFLMNVIEDLATRLLARRDDRWRVQVAGNLNSLPPSTAGILQEAVAATANNPDNRHLTLAIGYGGRQEIVDAFRDYLRQHAITGMTLAELAQELEIDDISRHLYTPDLPDVDLIIRTSGEQRSSNFLLWQGVRADYYFCDAYWPAFREVDLLRAVRGYAGRHRSHR